MCNLVALTCVGFESTGHGMVDSARAPPRRQDSFTQACFSMQTQQQRLSDGDRGRQEGRIPILDGKPHTLSRHVTDVE